MTYSVELQYNLELTKPDNIRGSIHGKIDAYIDFYNEVINIPTNQLNANTIKDMLKKKLLYLGCNNLKVIEHLKR
jgi:hypothetical protein